MTDMTVAETARALSVSERTVRRWIATGRLRAYRVGGRVRVPEHAARETRAAYATSTASTGDPGPGLPADDAGAGAPGGRPRGDVVLDWLGSGRAAWRLERRRRALDEIKRIAAATRPPRDESDTAEAYIRELRDGREYDDDEPEPS